MIKLETLRVFVTVAETGNIRDAALSLHRTPSAISMTLKQLEAELGADLFQSDRKNALTPLGAFVRETASVQIDAYDRAIASIRAFAQNRIGRLSLVAVPSVAASMLPSLLGAFAAERPGVEIELFDTDSRSVCAMVESGRADIGFAGVPQPGLAVEFEPIFTDRFKVICRADAPLASLGRPLTWADLAGEVIIRNGAAEAIRQQAYRDLADRASLTVRNVTSLLAFVRAGAGITLLPELATSRLPEEVVALGLADDGVNRVVGIVTRGGGPLNSLAGAFRDFVRASAPKFSGQLGSQHG